MDAGKLHQSTKKPFVVPVRTLATAAVPLNELAVGQLGIMTSVNNSGYAFTDAPKATRGAVLQILQGVNKRNPANKMLHTHTSGLSKRTVEFKATDIVKWYGKKARKTATSQKVAIGWDGINNEKNFAVDKYVDNIFHLRLTGGPINKLMGHNKGLWVNITVGRECFDSCNETNNPLCVDGSPNVGVDEFIRVFKQRKINGKHLTDLVHISKLSSDVLSGLTTFYVFRVSLPDNGDDTSLGLVQAQYPGVGVKRIDYLNGVSTYEVTLTTNSAPAAVSNAGLTTLIYCATCPAGYTASTPLKKYEVTLNHGAATTQFTGVTGYSSNVAISKSATYGDKYLVYSTNATNEATFTAAIVTNGGDATFIGIDTAVCTLTTPTTYAWALGDTVTKASKNYKLTLSDDECGTSRLSDIQAAYPLLTIAGDASATNCVRNYTTTIYSSNYAEVGCYPETYDFDPIAPFEGSSWVEVVSSSTEPDNVGVLLEGVVFNQHIPDYMYDYFAFDHDQVDGVHIEVSTHSNNYMDSPCDLDVPVTVLSNYEYPSGEGWYVRTREEEAAGYEMDVYRFGLPMREAFGQTRFTKLDKFYDTYYLEVNSHKNGAFDDVADHTYLYEFYFETGTGKAFENAINNLIIDAKIEIAPISL